ncbi:T9SS type A sorting domain-containing protein [Hymenobacter sp. 102]|uniref:T9SS type A sorting domain-containing protein n=1 Tax=Hymenobacter sp. 102 TaxID=3403152 RepID=UPI003CF68531
MRAALPFVRPGYPGILLCGAWALAACETGPTVRFEPLPPLAAPRNLVDVLGPAGRLLGPDTTQFVLRYDPRTQLNQFSMIRAADTVPWFAARAFRYRGLYYLVTSGSDSASNWVHAARITRRSVQGLGTGYPQMQDLSAAVEGGQFAKLVRFRNFSADSVVMRFDKVALHRFYRTLPDSFPTYRLETAGSAPATAPLPEYPSVGTFSLYPNPAAQAVTATFAAPEARTIHVLDAAGRTVRTIATSAATTRIALDNFALGFYLLRVTPARGPVLRSQRLEVVR